MGRDHRRPESADSWGEFHALIDMERDARENAGSASWRIVAALLFVTGLVLLAYAFQGGRPWLFLCALPPLAVVGVMASRALEHAERDAQRAEQLELLERAWQAHLRGIWTDHRLDPPG
jgi:hypothetical protein